MFEPNFSNKKENNNDKYSISNTQIRIANNHLNTSIILWLGYLVILKMILFHNRFYNLAILLIK